MNRNKLGIVTIFCNLSASLLGASSLLPDVNKISVSDTEVIKCIELTQER